MMEKHGLSYEELDKDFPILIQRGDTNQIRRDIRRSRPVYDVKEDYGLTQVIDGSKWKRVGPQLGSNKGGTYTAPDGKLHYVKQSSRKHMLRTNFLQPLSMTWLEVTYFQCRPLIQVQV